MGNSSVKLESKTSDIRKESSKMFSRMNYVLSQKKIPLNIALMNTTSKKKLQSFVNLSEGCDHTILDSDINVVFYKCY